MTDEKSSVSSKKTVAIIAGSGRFPFCVAKEAKRQGLNVIAIGIQNWADPSLKEHVDIYEEIAVGQMGRFVKYLKSHGVSEAVMAGKVTKGIFFDPRASFDAQALEILARVKSASVSELLGAVADYLAKCGITLLDSSVFLKDSICPVGVLTERSPTARENNDISIGLSIARSIAEYDIGQTVIVKDKVIIAVEALEGTDAAIRRAYGLSGAGTVVVKTASPKQDRRFDLPVVGLETLRTMKETQSSCLAIEADSTLLLDRKEIIAFADDAKICIVGVSFAAT